MARFQFNYYLFVSGKPDIRYWYNIIWLFFVTPRHWIYSSRPSRRRITITDVRFVIINVVSWRTTANAFRAKRRASYLDEPLLGSDHVPRRFFAGPFVTRHECADSLPSHPLENGVVGHYNIFLSELSRRPRMFTCRERTSDGTLESNSLAIRIGNRRRTCIFS